MIFRMDNSKIKVKILREDTIIITKSMLAKISTPSDLSHPTMDIEGKKYHVIAWKSHSNPNWNEIQNNSEWDYEIKLVSTDTWELT